MLKSTYSSLSPIDIKHSKMDARKCTFLPYRADMLNIINKIIKTDLDRYWSTFRQNRSYTHPRYIFGHGLFIQGLITQKYAYSAFELHLAY